MSAQFFTESKLAEIRSFNHIFEACMRTGTSFVWTNDGPMARYNISQAFAIAEASVAMDRAATARVTEAEQAFIDALVHVG